MTFSGGMEFAQPVPPGFWSVTMYDGVTRYTAPNPINRYTLGSDNDLKKNADGSFTLYLQHDNPGRGQGSQLAACAGGAVLSDPAQLRAGSRGRRGPEGPRHVQGAAAGDAGRVNASVHHSRPGLAPDGDLTGAERAQEGKT